MVADRAIQLLAGILIVISGGVSTLAHTPQDLERVLGKQEFYVQITDRPAPDFSLQDADGREVSLGDFRGKIVILNFIYGRCKEACPLHSNLIAEIQRMINGGPLRDAVQFISITTDPARDTRDVLKAYGPAHGLDPMNWVFLTSGSARPTETRELGERYGLKFTRTADGDFIHAVVTHVIDKQGVLRARFHSLKFDPANLVAYVDGLSTGDYEGAINLLRSRVPTRGASESAWTDISLETIWLPIAIGMGSGAIAFLLVWRLRRGRHGDGQLPGS